MCRRIYYLIIYINHLKIILYIYISMNVSFEEVKAKNLIKDIIGKLENVRFDEGEDKHYFYGGSKIPLYSEDGDEIETQSNHDIIDYYIPIIRNTFKGYTNWTNMSKGEKKCGNYLRWIINKIEERKQYPFKACRFPKYKTYFVKKYYLPDYCFN